MGRGGDLGMSQDQDYQTARLPAHQHRAYRRCPCQGGDESTPQMPPAPAITQAPLGSWAKSAAFAVPAVRRSAAHRYNNRVGEGTADRSPETFGPGDILARALSRVIEQQQAGGDSAADIAQAEQSIRVSRDAPSKCCRHWLSCCGIEAAGRDGHQHLHDDIAPSWIKVGSTAPAAPAGQIRIAKPSTPAPEKIALGGRGFREAWRRTKAGE